MPFSAYYNNSKRSGRSRRFRITADSGERNLSLEERGSDLGGGVERTSGAEVGSGGRERKRGSGGRERRRGSGGEVAEEREPAIPGP